MNTTKTIVTFALLLICGTTQAQLGRLVEKAAQKAVERKVEQSVNTVAGNSGKASIALSGAATPEAIIKQCPALPAVKQLVDGINTYASGPEIDAFHAKIEALRENAKRNVEVADKATEAVAREDGDRIARRFTGRSLDELENMNEADTEAMINQHLAASGLGNMTLAQLESLGDKSEEEIMAALTKSGATIGGLGLDEIMAMEGMTDAQKKAYMQKGDRAKRAKDFADSPQTKERLKQGEDAAIIMQVNLELQSINARWRELSLQIARENEETAIQIAALDAQYAPKVAAIKPTKWISGEDAGYIFTDAETKKREALFVACRTEQYTLWRNHTIKVQERIKAVIANEVPRYDELMKQQMIATGMTASAELMPSAGYGFAEQYLDAAASVTNLPDIEISGILGEGNY